MTKPPPRAMVGGGVEAPSGEARATTVSLKTDLAEAMARVPEKREKLAPLEDSGQRDLIAAPRAMQPWVTAQPVGDTAAKNWR